MAGFCQICPLPCKKCMKVDAIFCIRECKIDIYAIQYITVLFHSFDKKIT